jgi:light-regulated signal transduction histidine kinase (bacteriophytochrome)
MPEKVKTDYSSLDSSEPGERKKHDQAMSDYTYTVTHDLNAHLRHIMQYGELLQTEEKDRLSTDGAMYVDRLVVSTKRLQRLVNDLLSYASTLHREEEKEPVDLNAIVAEVTGKMADLIEAAHAKINVGVLPTLPAYRLRIAQIFSHLISNAIKYRSEKDPVITIDCVDKKTHYLFSVRDNGMGIPEKFSKQIFTPLKRLHAHDKIEGSGLGLAVCEKAVEAHGGKIWVESTPGEGAVFFFTLPRPLY